ncbi:MAG: DUF4384 domain-containing protein [Candidatus Bipolaricaulota bacterium]|nr:DUF4384 domain-containing protein [Candidatus Bipolaricaulota bacterium]
MRRALVALVLAGAGLAWAQEPSPLGLVPQPVPGLTVAIWTEKPHYYLGETARFFVYLSQPAYLYVFDIEPTGLVRLIFPNPYSPNPWKPAGTHVFPDGDYVFRVAPPAGRESLQALACRQPLPLAPGTEADPFPLLGPDPQAGRARVLGLVPDPSCGCCATAWTSFQILLGHAVAPCCPAPCPPVPCPPCWVGPCPPCLGAVALCPGMCWHYNPATGSWQVVIGEGCPGPGWCWCLGPDGQWRLQLRLCFGDCP